MPRGVPKQTEDNRKALDLLREYTRLGLMNREIAALLNSKGLPNFRGRPWSKKSVHYWRHRVGFPSPNRGGPIAGRHRPLATYRRLDPVVRPVLVRCWRMNWTDRRTLAHLNGHNVPAPGPSGRWTQKAVRNWRIRYGLESRRKNNGLKPKYKAPPVERFKRVPIPLMSDVLAEAPWMRRVTDGSRIVEPESFWDEE